VIRYLAILGSTGSVGVSALDVASSFPDTLRVVALAAGRNVELLARQVRAFHPELVSVRGVEERAALRAALGDAQAPEILCGAEGAEAVAAHPRADVVLSAMVGAVGLRPTLAAIRRGVTVAIANKEPLVIAGRLCVEEAGRCGATIIPVDSEHSAIYQSLRGHRTEDVHRLLLTGSGGPFRTTVDLDGVTLEQALRHPTWSMGPKITVDSATLMNKGLEVIEARWLFGVSASRIQILIHPESIVHSMVEYIDGSVVAQMGPPDMRLPISYALGFPARLPLPLPHLDLAQIARLTFEPPSFDRFPCLGLAYRALELGGTAPAVLNAANEVAVEAFLRRRVRYRDIPALIERVLDHHQPEPTPDLDALLAVDRWARAEAERDLPP
jgi:1-deoxy-D-xylulose-5-phosphate reductoisomerase